MRNKTPLIFLLGLILISLVGNSCKKDTQGTIESLFTQGSWQLASVVSTVYLGDAVVSTENLNTTCTSTQIFSFSTDKTCTYTNFECKVQPTAKGTWSLSPEKVILYADMVCQDTTVVGSSKPFAYTRVVNLGQYSMVLEIGDIQTYSLTKPRKIIRYGFVRQKTTIK